MNEKGEVTLLSCLLIFILMSIVLICGLELRKSFLLLEKRTKIFLCVKEAKGEHHNFMKFMGQTNWVIKHIDRASNVLMFIPFMQGVALKGKKLKKYLQYSQDAKLLLYLKTLKDLSSKGCPLDPRMYLTPFEILTGFKRDIEGAAKLRNEKWTYYFFLKPYFLSLEVNSTGWESLRPNLNYKAQEKLGKLPSLLSSAF